MTTTIRSLLVIALLAAPLVAQDSTARQKETPPAPGTPKNFRVPPRRNFTLPNGLQVTLVPFGRVPKVAVELEVRTGIIDQGPNDVSLSAVVGDMLLEGTTTRTAQDISRQAAEMGGSVSAVPGSEVVAISGEVLSDRATAFIPLLADVVMNPKFDEADLKRTLDKHSRNNAIALSSPGTLGASLRSIAASDMGGRAFCGTTDGVYALGLPGGRKIFPAALQVENTLGIV